MQRAIVITATTVVVLAFACHGRPSNASSEQPKKPDLKAKDVPTAVESIDPRGEPKAAAIKAIFGPKACIGYQDGEWAVTFKPGDVDWTRVDGWIEVDGEELTSVTGFNNLKTAGTGKSTKHPDYGKFNKKRIEFDLWVKSGGTDSFEFKVSEETRSIRFRFRIGQKLAASERILIGKEGRHPSQGEFSLHAHLNEPPNGELGTGGEKPKGNPKAKPGLPAAP